MSKPGRVPIKAAEHISDAYKCPVVIVWALEGNGSSFCVTTYGKTKALCRHAADIGRKISEAIMDGSITPAQVEPLDLPNVPTIFESKGDLS